MGKDLRNREVGRLARRCLQARERREVLRHRIGGLQLSLVLEHQDRDAGDRLGHRCDPEQRVGGHRALRRDICEAGGFEVEEAVPGYDRRDRARHFPIRHHRLHGFGDTRQSGLLSGHERGGGSDRERSDEGHGDEMCRSAGRPLARSGLEQQR
jgi:hypothetical protein